MAKSKSEQGRFAYEGLDRVIHEKARLERAHLAGRASEGTRVRRPEADVRADRRQSLAPSAGAAGGRAGRDREGLRPQSAADRSCASRRPGGSAISTISRCSNRWCATRRAPRRVRARRRTCGNSSQPEKFLRGHFTMQSTLEAVKTNDLHVAIIMDGNGRWAERREPAAQRRPSRRHRGGAPRGRGRARSRRRRADAVRVLGRQLAPPAARGRSADAAAAPVSAARRAAPRRQRRAAAR